MLMVSLRTNNNNISDLFPLYDEMDVGSFDGLIVATSESLFILPWIIFSWRVSI